MRLLIKNMVCIRCKVVVKEILENIGLHYILIELGEVEVIETILPKTWKHLNTDLSRFGFELMENKKSIIIEKIKKIIVEMIYYLEEPPQPNFSNYLSRRMGYEYHYLSNLFSEIEGKTIEHHVIDHKIERVKKLLICEELSLTEIAYRLHYSSVSHLSNQFKKVTGSTPSTFKKMENQRLSGNVNV